ncbi:hypothetical protein JAAARDRAFT_40504 [Jaapia argillacea MUCL 33604]|uniref:Cytochrome P450 n=1 Tax=Jaapia argillacea MUCL 33604 TaxID=933084 RepID=A0A067PM34_9AGAM|nr:hypothetical protein JAAARDRAFT_40504 [Jaapia argillacea MUCL 33604]
MANSSYETLSFARLVNEPWPSTNLATSAAFGGFLFLITYYAYPTLFPKKGAIHQLGGISILNAWSFFTKRYDFLRENLKKQAMFQFWVLNHRVVALSGEEGRRVFFTDKSLDFSEGYKILMGGAPRLEDIKVKQAPAEQEGVSWFNKRVALLLRKERLETVLPSLFDEIQVRMEEWGKEGRINPFENVNDLVFQMTVRMATCQALSSDIPTVKRLYTLYWILEKSATPITLLWPWLPTPTKRGKDKATKDMFDLLDGYVEMRRRADVLGEDALDLLIAEGDSNKAIIQFVMGVTFAGVINTGMNSCWLLLHLAANPEWRMKIHDEVTSLMNKYTDSNSPDPLHKRLATIPIPAWEDDMPNLDLAIRECLRLTLSGTTLRRNVAQDLHVGDKIIEKGSFMAYSLADAHLNPEIYTNPDTFDPFRFEAGREEDKKGNMSYLAWGTGRHPCTGMKVAKLEIKMIIAMFLAGYEYQLVDGSGRFPKPFPKPNRNDLQQVSTEQSISTMGWWARADCSVKRRDR